MIHQERDGQARVPLEHRCAAVGPDQLVEVLAIPPCPPASLGERLERVERMVGSCRLHGLVVRGISGPSRRGLRLSCGRGRGGGVQRRRPPGSSSSGGVQECSRPRQETSGNRDERKQASLLGHLEKGVSWKQQRLEGEREGGVRGEGVWRVGQEKLCRCGCVGFCVGVCAPPKISYFGTMRRSTSHHVVGTVLRSFPVCERSAPVVGSLPTVPRMDDELMSSRLLASSFSPRITGRFYEPWPTFHRMAVSLAGVGQRRTMEVADRTPCP